MARLSTAQWLGRLRAKGWTRSQIEQATGASPSTQWRISTGRQASSKYDASIREAGARYSRRSKVPPEYPHRPKPKRSLASIIEELEEAQLEPGADTDSGIDLDWLLEQFGQRGTRAILTRQLRAHKAWARGNSDDGYEWYHSDGPEMMLSYSDGLVDPMTYRGQLWYHGR